MKIKTINSHLNIVQTRKYKDINIYLRFSISYDHKAKATASILGKLVGEQSNLYKDKVSMSRAKDMLYGLTITSGYKIRGNIISFNVNYCFINPKFLNTDLDYYIAFIKETLYNTLITENNIQEAKRNVISYLRRRLDRPQVYASERVNQIIAKDNKDFLMYDYSDKFIKDINEVNIDDVKKLYKYLLTKAQLDIYLCGDINNKLIKAFDFDFSKRKKVNTNNIAKKYPTRKTIIDSKDISQSTLCVLYSSPFTRTHKDFGAFVLGNVFLGVVPTSLLFEEVREKLGLCYSIGVSEYKNEGIVRIYTDIDAKNKNIVIKQIDTQIKRLIDMDYDVSKFEASKMLFLNIINSTYDDLNALIEFDMEFKLAGINMDIDKYGKYISKVTPIDISNVFKQYKPYFVYMLKGTNNE